MATKRKKLVFVSVAAWCCALSAAEVQVSGTCTPSKGQMLFQHGVSSKAYDETVAGDDSDSVSENKGNVMHSTLGLTSCVDGQTPRRSRELPAEISHKGNPYNETQSCQYNVEWEKSEDLLALMVGNDDDPEQFMFKVCWAVGSDPEYRTFPWMHANTADWKWHLMHGGAVMLSPMQLNPLWMKGYVNIMLDALDYFARMGEVFNRKILPRFMLYGWSKGATANWVLGRWRPDIIQAVVSVSGLKQTRSYTKVGVRKSKIEGSSPYFFVSSEKDTFTPQAHKDARRQFNKLTQSGIDAADFMAKKDFECGHHPDNCLPLCDYNASYATPFRDFVRTAFSWRGCPHWTTKDDCNTYLCKWDSELQRCDMLHPTEINPSCERFCNRTQVDTCAGTPMCESSYRTLSMEEASANGMHVACRLDGERCVDSADVFQCFFQDQCQSEQPAIQGQEQ